MKTLAGLLVVSASALSCTAAQAQTELTDVFQNALACTLIQPLLADVTVNRLYVQDEAACLPRIPDEPSLSYFSDAACERPVSFSATTVQEYCDVLLDPVLLGEGQGVVEDQWTLSPGSRLDVGARKLDGVLWPYLQRRIYRNVDTAGGRCSLEMRIYSPSPEAPDTDRPAMLAFHGGSWSSRGFGFFGLEMSIPHFVDQGFVVYAPFYRLLDDKEGSAACNQADIGQIVDDAKAALAWVQEHAADYGSSDTPVVFGQSAGAHLATALAVDESESVSSAILLYPPTDFTDFVMRAQQGYYTDTQGLGILERVLGVGVAQADVSASPIPENSFPQRIVESDLSVPPVFMIHGMQDNLVEARQSTRLCDALAGRELAGVGVEVAPPEGLRSVTDCGADSTLQLITEGQHALDVCVVDTLVATDLCLSGSDQSREEVSLAIGDAVAFALDNSAPDGQLDGDGNSGGNTDDDTNQGSSGAGGVGWQWLVLLSALMLHRYRFFRGVDTDRALTRQEARVD